MEWFTAAQQRHILLQRVGGVPTMTELERQMSYREVAIPGVCWFCGQPDTQQHAWDCYATIHVTKFLRQGQGQGISWGSDFLVVWAMATTTDGFKDDKLSVASKDSMGVQFLRQAVDASMRLHSYRYSHREVLFRKQYPQLATLRQWLHARLESRRRGDRLDDENPEAEQQDAASTADSDAAGWSTEEDEEVWDTRFRGDLPHDVESDSSCGENEWPFCDDFQEAEAPPCEDIHGHDRCS